MKIALCSKKSIGKNTNLNQDTLAFKIEKFFQEQNVNYKSFFAEDFLSSTELFSELEKFNPQLIISTQFPFIFRSNFIEKYANKIVNIHNSLLPKYRGCAPISHAIINGEKTHGTTLHFIDQGIDSGQIIDQIEFKITNKTNEEVYKKCDYYGFILFCRNWSQLKSGKIKSFTQDNSRASYYPKNSFDYSKNMIPDNRKNLKQHCLAYYFPPFLFPCDKNKNPITKEIIDKIIANKKNVIENLYSKTIKISNPQNLIIFDDDFLINFNKEIKSGIHGTLIKYVHGMANKNNINPINLQKKSAAKNLELAVKDPEVLSFKNAKINHQMIVFDKKNNVIKTNINSYYEWDDGLIPNNIFKPKKYLDLFLKLLKNYKIISKETNFIIRKKIALKKYSKQFLKKNYQEYEIENGLVFCDNYYYVFGHFMHENYPRLYYAWSQLSAKEKKNIKIILPPKLDPYSSKSSEASYFSYINPCLEVLEINKNQCVYLQKDQLLKVKNLTMPSQIRYHDIVKQSLRHMNDFYYDKDRDFNKYEKIYLSRNNALRRKVVNEEEVRNFLVKKGFEIVVIEDHDFKTQMNILRNAKIVLAQDSSTLTNVIFCQNCQHCIIFTCDKITSPLFSSVIDAKFYYQFCEPEDRKNFEWYSSNIIIDTLKLEKILSQI